MLRFLIPLGFFAATFSVSAALLQKSFPAAWSRWLKRAVLGAGAATALGVVLFAASVATSTAALRLAGLLLVAPVLTSSTLLFLTSPIWAVPIGALKWRASKQAQAVHDDKRRAFLFRGATTVPAMAAAAGPAGTLAAMLSPVVRQLAVPVTGLHPDLAGLRILQISDVHLGPFISVAQVERAVAAVKAMPPDLVVLTGDIADDYGKLGPALDIIATLAPPLGTFAILGNHEIFRGRAAAKAIYDRKGVPLLVNEGRTLSKGEGQLYLAGVDDPARLGGDHRTFLANAVRQAMEPCPDDVSCRLLLSHRPEGFEAGRKHGANLTLSGHTHGGQVGLFGRSLFEPIAPRSYLMGHYQSEDSHLFTSAGLGHWFPFRIGCPCEVTLVTLLAA